MYEKGQKQPSSHYGWVKYGFSLWVSLNWAISHILIWWRQAKIQNNILDNFLPHRTENDSCSENSKLHDDRVFCFLVGGFSVFKISWKCGETWLRQF